MKDTIFDIFISYRREGGGATAGRINDMLTADGYSVSYDVDTLREGRFDKQLLERIEQCQDFILVVDKNCFVRTIDPNTDPQDDWLWQELSYALKLKKNVIPVLLAGADFPKQLPDDINSVRFHNGPKCVHEYFDSFYKKLKDQLHAFPRIAKPTHSISGASTSKLPNLKLKADADCVFYLDGEERAHLKAGIIQKFPLAPGEYELMFVSADNAKDRIEMEFEMPETDKLQRISLSEVINTRRQKEKEEREIEIEIEEKRLEEEKRRAEEQRQREEQRQGEEQRQAELRSQEAERKAVEERKRDEVRRRREEEAQLGIKEFTVKGVSFKMIWVEGGTFQMGGTEEQGRDAADDEKPVHSVTLNSYYIGQTEVTQMLWMAVMGSNPSCYKGDNLPVEKISWDDCQMFITKLNQLTGQKFRLPTEAEWEYAARGGKQSNGYKYSGSNILHDVAWYSDYFNSKTHPVATKRPNELGLYDMSGNVWEWCQDRYGPYVNSVQSNPKGPSLGSLRVNRGGSWLNFERNCRVSFRNFNMPSNADDFIGLRLAL